MTNNTTVLVITVDSEENLYEDGLDAIRALERGESIDQQTTVTFPNEKLLAKTFNGRTYTVLRVIRDEEPSSIRETARLVDRDKKNVHEELTTLEALGVIRFDEDGQSKRPVFPFDELLIRPVAPKSDDAAAMA